MSGLIIPSVGFGRQPVAGGGDLLLNTFPGAVLAASLRKLDKDFAGAAVSLREKGGDTLADIGFDGAGVIDTAAAESHCGANDGTVAKIYTQAGSIDLGADSLALEPKLVSAGSIITDPDNGNPAIFFDNSDDLLLALALNGDANLTDASIFVVFNLNSENALSERIVGFSNFTGTTKGTDTWSLASDSSLRFDGDALTGHSQTLSAGDNIRHCIKNGTAYSEWFNGVKVLDAAGSSEVVHDDFWVGAGGNPTQQYFQEVVVYLSDQEANQAGIESDQNDYHGVFA